LILFVLYGAAFDALSHGVLRYAESGRGLRYRKTLYCQVLYPSTRVRPPDRLSKRRDRAGRARAALRKERARSPILLFGDPRPPRGPRPRQIFILGLATNNTRKRGIHGGDERGKGEIVHFSPPSL
jgi:hypothetical protein